MIKDNVKRFLIDIDKGMVIEYTDGTKEKVLNKFLRTNLLAANIRTINEFLYGKDKNDTKRK